MWRQRPLFCCPCTHRHSAHTCSQTPWPPPLPSVCNRGGHHHPSDRRPHPVGTAAGRRRRRVTPRHRATPAGGASGRGRAARRSPSALPLLRRAALAQQAAFRMRRACCALPPLSLSGSGVTPLLHAMAQPSPVSTVRVCQAAGLQRSWPGPKAWLHRPNACITRVTRPASNHSVTRVGAVLTKPLAGAPPTARGAARKDDAAAPARGRPGPVHRAWARPRMAARGPPRRAGRRGWGASGCRRRPQGRPIPSDLGSQISSRGSDRGAARPPRAATAPRVQGRGGVAFM